MNYQLAQLNIAKFKRPAGHHSNDSFVNNIDRINAVAERQPGFVWRYTGDAGWAFSDSDTEDLDIIVNMSVWTDLDSLVSFVYKNEEHVSFLKRRKEWFSVLDVHLVHWWIKQGEFPSIVDARRRLNLLKKAGATAEAFTFKTPFPPSEA